MIDRYGTDIFASDPHAGAKRTSRSHELSLGDVVEEVETGWVGAAIRVEKSGGVHVVELEDRRGRIRTFPLGPGFLIDGQPVILTPPRSGPKPAPAATRTASGSVATGPTKAKVALPSRIWVEGRQDADLIMKVWGEDLAYDGVAIELLEGVDNLAQMLREFQPQQGKRVGVLVDHFVPGSKETRLVDEALRGLPGRDHVLVLGHPYVDVWQAIKPERVGLSAWPEIPRHIGIKVGSLQALGLPHANQADIARGWQAILARVRTYADLEPSLIGRMEELIDFVLADKYGQ
ncbi:hypothetical protein BSZ39_02765 [Bowdeniella nasicola]|uniref:DUF3097 domain-containing protein n=1 Tax=Bowdeniella nasicola TaxID=208480 RepID=A0A1Q5Q4G8_9ACTO|nr:DUF3097 family protein [Bowdeniella nasicola]OKL54724.1 hypothetical protein BSZ39_02765 [Bowdeniella nasicola]